MNATLPELALCKSITSLAGLDASCYAMEPKLDGFRLLVTIDSNRNVASWTRTFHSATGKAVAAERAISDVATHFPNTTLDGEAVYIAADGTADFHFTSSVMGSGVDVAKAKQKLAQRYVSFVAFDILQLLGQDVRHLPWSERRAMLERVVEAVGSEHVRVTEVASPTQEQHDIYTKQYGEGSVVKLKSAPYSGGRSKSFLKWKKVAEEDVVVMGMEPGKGKFANQVGAVIFGQYVDGVLVERGQCSGMDDATRLAFTRCLPIGEVMVVNHNGVLAKGKFRHPQFKAMRTDKLATDCTWTTEED